MACNIETTPRSRSRFSPRKFELRSVSDPGAVAITVVAEELDQAVTRALGRLDKEGVSQDISWEALRLAIDAMQRCLAGVDADAGCQPA